MEAMTLTQEGTESGMDALERAFLIIGDGERSKGIGRLAERLGLDPMTVRQWKLRSSVPPNRAIEIEEATGGQVTRAELRPDLFG